MASLVTNTIDIDKCSKFINKVREDRFFKVRDRQVNKFNRLDSKSNNNSSSHNNQVQATGKSNSINSYNNHLQEEINNKWVKNLSKTPLPKGQKSLLGKGPNFAIAPNKVPNVDYITAVESICHKLKEEDGGELRADVSSLLRRAQVPKPNLAKQESIGLAQLKKDKERVVLTADKGVAMVVMDKEEYIDKAESLLVQLAYRSIDWDPTSKIKATLVTTLRKIKMDTNIDEGTYKTMYLTSCMPPSFMVYLKSLKLVTPSGQLYQVGVQLPMGLLKSLQRC